MSRGHNECDVSSQLSSSKQRASNAVDFSSERGMRGQAVVMYREDGLAEYSQLMPVPGCMQCMWVDSAVAIRLKLLKPRGFSMYHQDLHLKNSTCCSLCVECFVRISEQAATFPLYRGADKSLDRPARKQAKFSVRMT